jgi:uncharacterized protein (DUF4415 family)
MLGSKRKLTEREQILEALKKPPEGGYFEWDGKDEDDRPATKEELDAALEAYRKKRGRPAGSGTKTQVAIRFDTDVVEALRASGPGWQTRVSDAVAKLVRKGRL